jgi:leucine dehydrogenase
LRAIVAVHSTALGPAFGGIRRRVYPDEDTALSEVLGLAQSMTRKCALADLRAGGAKTVILDHDGMQPEVAYRALGRIVEQLEGAYVCGPDIGTGDEELDWVRSGTRHVNPKGNDAGASTAAGVLAGLRGVLRVLHGEVDLGRHHYFVQGLGSVGLALAETLRDAGARVSGADLRGEAARAAAALGVDVVPVAAALDTPCDVFMPCALGHVIDREVASTLPCSAVCGSANEQLADEDAAAVLHGRRIALAPDIVVSAGAVIEGVLTIADGTEASVRARVARGIAAIEDTTVAVLEEARRSGRPPTAVAFERAQRIVAQGPAAQPG